MGLKIGIYLLGSLEGGSKRIWVQFLVHATTVMVQCELCTNYCHNHFYLDQLHL